VEPHIYSELAEQEDAHWWFCARRAIAASLLKRFKLPSNAKILDAGCGSGGNLAILAQFGEVCAFEMDDASCARARSRAIGQVEAGTLPGGIPFAGQAFDLITLFDVLEHIEDDAAALDALANRLAPEGMLLLNVPAFQWLFSRHDILHHHYRRYGWNDLRQKLEAAGLKICLMNYWNFWLFPAVATARIIERLCPSRHDALGSGTPPIMLNKLLTFLASSERFLIPRLRLPFGTSIVVLAKKRN